MSAAFDRIARRLNRQSPKSDLDKAVQAAVDAYLADHPTEAPAPQQKPIPRRLRALVGGRPRPVTPSLAPPVSSPAGPAQAPLPVQGTVGGALSAPLQIAFSRDEEGLIRAASFVGPNGQQHELRLQRDEVGRAARVNIDGHVLLVQRSASGAAVALVPTDQGQPYIHEGKPVLPAPLNTE